MTLLLCIGITLDSLIKTAKKKGSDGKTTVIDILVQQALTNKLDIVEFWSDMPAVRGAMRMDLEDFRQLLREIEIGAQRAQSLIESENYQTESKDGSENYHTKMSTFLRRASGEIEEIKTLFGLVEGKVQSLCSFFAEDFKTCKVSYSIFPTFCSFLDILT